MTNKRKLLLVGPYPPPFGGASIHIMRLSAMLQQEYDVRIIDESKRKKNGYYNIRTLNPIRYVQLMAQSDVVHIHSGHYILRLLHFCVARLLRKEVVVTIHSYALNNKSRFEYRIDRIVLSKANKVVFVSEEIARKFKLTNGYVKEAFLPPEVEREERLPVTVEQWVDEKKASGYITCCANAWRLEMYNNEDLYGLDLCIQVAGRCRDEGLRVAMVFIVCSNDGKFDTATYRDQIRELGLADCFLLYDLPLSFVRLINACDVVLRPTNTDGDALTVREGLFFKKIVLASDVVRRPEHTHLFRNRNVDSFFDALALISKQLAKEERMIGTAGNGLPASKQFYSHVLYN